MSERFYTLASWRVHAGQEEEFLRVWREELSAAFLRANPTARGTLIQSLEDPRQFYSFGPWDSLEQMQVARSDPHVRDAIGKLIALCEEATPGPYRVVLTVP
ncbi:MAG TPA: antibiotic biosynthesis monooxygenase [Ardenticatenaceae bacterium]|nr:antibiotic biosynthesis monooxygenase [Ardenticatenaceae bacterium]